MFRASVSQQSITEALGGSTNMNLSTLIGGGVNPYLEFAWVCNPSTTAAQSITANTITTLTVDTKIVDTGNFGSIASNQITLAAGTYYFKANVPLAGASYANILIFGLYNVTLGTWVTRKQNVTSNYAAPIQTEIDGQLTIASATIFELRAIVSYVNGSVGKSYVNQSDFTLSASGADQRTTLKLWKLA
jgi:hypothetical protein